MSKLSSILSDIDQQLLTGVISLVQVLSGEISTITTLHSYYRKRKIDDVSGHGSASDNESLVQITSCIIIPNNRLRLRKLI